MKLKIAVAVIVDVILFVIFSYSITKAGNVPSVIDYLSYENQSMKISSSAFENGTNIPSEFTCDGEDISPPLDFVGIPKETKTLALVMNDQDVAMGNFIHWIVWNIPSNKTQFVKGEKIDSVQGLSSFGKNEYKGPCPPSGTHRYFFKLYALDTQLNLSMESGVTDFQKSMLGHVIEENQLMGKYQR